MRILIIQLRQLGDILLTTPCAKALKQEDSSRHICFLSHDMGKLILKDNPYIDEHWTYGDSLLGQLKLHKKLLNTSFDLVFDFMNNPRSVLFTVLARAKHSVAFKTRRSFFYTDLVERADHSDYVVREKFKLLKKLDFSPKDESLTLPWGNKDLGPLLELYNKDTSFRDADIRVVLSPTHRREARQWPGLSYAELADELTLKWGAHVMWLWGPGEKDFVLDIQKHCKQKTFLAPKTAFRELAALIANADLFVGNSNGPSHLAVSSDVCSLQFHGPTQAKAWCPLSEQHQAISSMDISQTESIEGIKFEDAWSVLGQFKERILKRADERKKSPSLQLQAKV